MHVRLYICLPVNICKVLLSSAQGQIEKDMGKDCVVYNIQDIKEGVLVNTLFQRPKDKEGSHSSPSLENKHF